MSDIELITRAWNFSAQRHVKQKRKGEAQKPYVNHLAEVAELVAEATKGRDANLVAAAVLHDTVEDTETSPDELRNVFNTDIADLVAEVIDNKSLEKARRKQLQIEHAASKSARALRIGRDRDHALRRQGPTANERCRGTTTTIHGDTVLRFFWRRILNPRAGDDLIHYPPVQLPWTRP